MNKLVELLEAERPIIPDSNADYYIGYNNGLVMAQAIVLKRDVVEVVRCKDCRFSELDKAARYKPIGGEAEKPVYRCFYHWNGSETVNRNHFCSHGERKDK